MAIDNASFISDMNPDIPANTDVRFEGAGQIRAVKAALKGSFPNVDDVVNADAATMNAVFDQPNNRFVGEVTMFSGDVNSLPKGWVLCDGSTKNGFITPDLRGKFIRGYDNANISAAVGTGGGSNEVDDLSVYLTSQAHSLIKAELPSEPIDFVFDSSRDNGENSGGEHYLVPKGTGARDPQPATYDFTLGDGIGHSHGLVSSGEVLNIMPEYVILAFIVFVGV